LALELLEVELRAVLRLEPSFAVEAQTCSHDREDLFFVESLDHLFRLLLRRGRPRPDMVSLLETLAVFIVAFGLWARRPGYRF